MQSGLPSMWIPGINPCAYVFMLFTPGIPFRFGAMENARLGSIVKFFCICLFLYGFCGLMAYAMYGWRTGELYAGLTPKDMSDDDYRGLMGLLLFAGTAGLAGYAIHFRWTAQAWNPTNIATTAVGALIVIMSCSLIYIQAWPQTPQFVVVAAIAAATHRPSPSPVQTAKGDDQKRPDAKPEDRRPEDHKGDITGSLQATKPAKPRAQQRVATTEQAPSFFEHPYDWFAYQLEHSKNDACDRQDPNWPHCFGDEEHRRD